MISFKELSEKWGMSDGSYRTKDGAYKELGAHYIGIKDENKKSISDYRGFGSMDINHDLWEKHKNPNYSMNSDSKNHINRIDDEIHRNKTPRKMVVWSGTRHDPRKLKDENNIVHHPAYLSTSLNREVGEQFSKLNEKFKKTEKDDYNGYHHLMKIIVPKDHPGHLTKSSTEQEFILPRDTKLKYKGTSTEIKHDNISKDITNFYHTHHMEVVPHENI